MRIFTSINTFGRSEIIPKITLPTPDVRPMQMSGKFWLFFGNFSTMNFPIWTYGTKYPKSAMGMEIALEGIRECWLRFSLNAYLTYPNDVLLLFPVVEVYNRPCEIVELGPAKLLLFRRRRRLHWFVNEGEHNDEKRHESHHLKTAL